MKGEETSAPLAGLLTLTPANAGIAARRARKDERTEIFLKTERDKTPQKMVMDAPWQAKGPHGVKKKFAIRAWSAYAGPRRRQRASLYLWRGRTGRNQLAVELRSRSRERVMLRQEVHCLATLPQVAASGVLRIAGEVACTLESTTVPVCNRLLTGMTKAVPCVEKTSRVGELFFTGDYLVGRFSSPSYMGF